MATKITFYEFLVRGAADGKIAGMHVVYRKIFTDEDGDSHDKILPAQEVRATDNDLLASIAGEINTASLASIESLRAELQQAKTDAQTASQLAEATIADLKKQLAAVPAKPAPAPPAS